MPKMTAADAGDLDEFAERMLCNPTKIFEEEGQPAATPALHMISSPTDEAAARLIPQT